MPEETIAIKPYPDPDAIPFWFTHKQPPTPEQAAKYEAIHQKGREFAEFLARVLPMDQAESGFAFQKVEEAVYWAVTGVSRS
jgi:hypothetical protein